MWHLYVVSVFGLKVCKASGSFNPAQRVKRNDKLQENEEERIRRAAKIATEKNTRTK